MEIGIGKGMGMGMGMGMGQELAVLPGRLPTLFKMRVLQGVMFALGMICTLLVPVLGDIELVGQSIKDALAEYTLTDIMNNNQFAGIEFGEAEDGFPAFRFLQTADVKSPYRMLLPEKLYEIVILITFRQSSLKDGYLFSVVIADTVVQLGVHLSPVVKNSYNVSLVYTQADQNIGRKLASFGVAHVPDKWNSIALQVLSDKVSFYYDCELRNTTLVTREPIELVFDSASTLYIGQAGSIIGGKFEMARGRLKDEPIVAAVRSVLVLVHVHIHILVVFVVFVLLVFVLVFGRRECGGSWHYYYQYYYSYFCRSYYSPKNNCK
ncbi:GM14812 [Drosophila sechellia]|uniref:GM14812 n=1 Tax=Drosophila sechellia TaxID=7238 RepID=B4HV07_DROSE|nr:GM14812 [Drosophila sechellia]